MKGNVANPEKFNPKFYPPKFISTNGLITMIQKKFIR